MEQRHEARQSFGGAPGKLECPVCHTALSEPEHEHAMYEVQRIVGDAMQSAPNVKYQRSMKSVRSPEGTELLSFKEGYTRLSSGAAGHVEALLSQGSEGLKSAYGSASSLVMRKYRAFERVFTRNIPDILMRLVAWFQKWLFIAFKKMADALAAVTG